MKFCTITIFQQPGIGTEYNIWTRAELDKTITKCIKLNQPFQVGHMFGNIDGTHPKWKGTN